MRLRTRKHFRRQDPHARKFTGQWILAEFRATAEPLSRLGITVTKRYGEAFQRNRFKRLVREAFRHSARDLTHPFDIIIKPRTLALHAGMQQIQDELSHFMRLATAERV